jgi:3-oxoacyl-[acyl-carrier protein] reductase
VPSNARAGARLQEINGNTGAAATAALDGLRVVVTGAGSGIGRAIALAAARAGADVALSYRANERGAREAAAEIERLGRRAPVFRLDLASEPSVAEFAGAVQGALGRVDAWVNNAGADVLTGAAASMSRLEKLDLLLAVDLRGTMLASWRAAELMAEQEGGGVIINMSWDHVLTGMAGRNQELFSAVKGGVLSFSKSLARSVAPRVRVNVLAPGWIETAFGAGADERWRREVAESTPLKRWGTPDDVAGAAVFLASPAAAFLTGQAILVGGGVVM